MIRGRRAARLAARRAVGGGARLRAAGLDSPRRRVVSSPELRRRPAPSGARLKSYLLSWLRKTHAGHGLERFEAERPGPWLVWEAGPWRPPSARLETLAAGPQTRLLASGESLAIELASRRGGDEVRIGRAAENDLVVDDATLSRVHLVLRRGPDRAWTAQDAGSRNGTKVDGAPARSPLPLRRGSLLEAGAVRLTYYDAAGLYARLRAP